MNHERPSTFNGPMRRRRYDPNHHICRYICGSGTQRPSSFRGDYRDRLRVAGYRARITTIRDADMKDINDYLRAYSEIVPLPDAYESRAP